MKFLIDARLPFLDGYVSEFFQSILVELTFWTVIYAIYASTFHHLVRAIYRKLPLWKRSHKVQGIMLGNGRDDSVFLTMISAHHSICGMLMIMGVANNDSDLWRHGYLLETSYELYDLLSMVLRVYPYTSVDGMKPDLQAALIFHHIPGMTAGYSILSTGLYENIHLQTLITALLLGAAVSAITAVIIYNLDLNSKSSTTLAAIFSLANNAFFFYWRIIVFPKECWLFLQDLRADPTMQGTPFFYMLIVGGVILFLFTAAVLGEGIPLALRYTKRAMDGKSPIHSGTVPRSRDSLLLRGKQQQPQQSPRRRSSVVQLVQDTQRRASSFSHKMSNITLVDQVINASAAAAATSALSETKDKDKSHQKTQQGRNKPASEAENNTSKTSIEESISDLAEDDQKALLQTLANMAGTKNKDD